MIQLRLELLGAQAGPENMMIKNDCSFLSVTWRQVNTEPGIEEVSGATPYWLPGGRCDHSGGPSG